MFGPWGALIGGVAGGAAGILGGVMGGESIEKAVNKYNEALSEVSQFQLQANSAATEKARATAKKAADQAMEAAKKASKQLQTAARKEYKAYSGQSKKAYGEYDPSARYFSQVMNQPPEVLTDYQRRQLGDLQREGRANMAASGTRGAGRAGIAAVLDQSARFRERAADENLRRSDAAAGALVPIAGSRSRILEARGAAAAGKQGQLGDIKAGRAATLGELRVDKTTTLGDLDANKILNAGNINAQREMGQASANMGALPGRTDMQSTVIGSAGGLLARLPDTFDAILAAQNSRAKTPAALPLRNSSYWGR